MANGIDIPALLKQFEARYKTGAAAQQGREATAMGALGESKAQYGPGYLAGEEKMALADMESSMVGRGMSNTSRPGAVSVGMKAQFRDMRRQGLAGANRDIANFAGSYRDPYGVSAGDVSHLATGGFSGLLQQSGMNLGYRQAVDTANQGVRAQNAQNLTDARASNPYMQSLLGGGGGGGGGSSGSNPYMQSLGGLSSNAPSLFGTGSGTGGAVNPQTFGTSANPFTSKTTGASAGGMVPGISTSMTNRQAFKQMSTYEQWAAYIKGKGLNPGSKQEWAAVKRRIG